MAFGSPHGASSFAEHEPGRPEQPHGELLLVGGELVEEPGWSRGARRRRSAWGGRPGWGAGHPRPGRRRWNRGIRLSHDHVGPIQRTRSTSRASAAGRPAARRRAERRIGSTGSRKCRRSTTHSTSMPSGPPRGDRWAGPRRRTAGARPPVPAPRSAGDSQSIDGTAGSDGAPRPDRARRAQAQSTRLPRGRERPEATTRHPHPCPRQRVLIDQPVDDLVIEQARRELGAGGDAAADLRPPPTGSGTGGRRRGAVISMGQPDSAIAANPRATSIPCSRQYPDANVSARST